MLYPVITIGKFVWDLLLPHEEQPRSREELFSNRQEAKWIRQNRVILAMSLLLLAVVIIVMVIWQPLGAPNPLPDYWRSYNR